MVALEGLQTGVAHTVHELLGIGRQAYATHTGDAIDIRDDHGTLLCHCAQAGDGRQS